ncbi:hypothetical protein ykris0001_3660 [Yersinia kristensenii ATCC 33638]|nr:hypothetical protein ykris0001_3660 [Yersinia kristensenii ATCC 33638]
MLDIACQFVLLIYLYMCLIYKVKNYLLIMGAIFYSVFKFC